MANLPGFLKQLKQERDRVQRQLAGLDAALKTFAKVYRDAGLGRRIRRLSATGRARIAAAQRARWAKFRAKRKS